MGGNTQSHIPMMVTTSVASTEPPRSSAPAYRNDLHRRTTMEQTNHTYYLRGFDSMVDLNYFTISKKRSWNPFRSRSTIAVFDQTQTQILSAKELEKGQQESDGVQRLLQCTDSFHRALFTLSRHTSDNCDDVSQTVPLISDPVEEDTLLGYIQRDEYTFKIMNIRKEVIITAKFDSKAKRITITKKLQSAAGHQEQQVGSFFLADGSTIEGNVSKDLDIGLKACVIAMAVYRLLRRRIFL